MKYTIGVDEVGRGPIAGPVAVGSFLFLNPTARKIFRKAKESKQLSEINREKWFAIIQSAKKKGLVDFAVTFQSRKVIDTKGLSYSIRTALKRSLESVVSRNRLKGSDVRIILDGGLKAPVEFKDQKTIIKGDEKHLDIALASICAKVLRDRKMVKLSAKYPKYGFDVHKGYGTRKHYAAIERWGMMEEHRRSFLGVRVITS